MKALITTGGRGTRVRSLTHTSNTPLIPIANTLMIHYAIDAVVARVLGRSVASSILQRVRRYARS